MSGGWGWGGPMIRILIALGYVRGTLTLGKTHMIFLCPAYNPYDPGTFVND